MPRRLPVVFMIAAVALSPFAAPPARGDDTVAAVKKKIEQAAAEVDKAVSPKIGWIEIEGTLREGPSPFAWVTEDELDLSVAQVVKRLSTVATAPGYQGVVLYLDYPDLTLTQVETIGAAVQKVRAAGRKVFAFAEAYDLRTYLLACFADEVLLQRKGEVMLTGLGMEEMYVAGLLDKVGMKADFIQVGKFKGAADPLTQTAPSPEWSANIDALLDDMYDGIVTRIGNARGLDRAAVEAVFKDSIALTDEQLVQRRVVDRLTDRDLVEVTEPLFGEDFEWDDELGEATATAQPANPFALFQTLFRPPAPAIKRDSIAVIHATGPITSAESTTGDGLFGEESIGSATMVRELADAADNDKVKAILVRLDSPGGSAIASEVVWQAMRQAAESKPVWISIGSMAASGGYYIASGAERVYVGEHSIVGSIGVVGGKLVAGGLYDMIGIHVHSRSRGPNGGLFNSATPFTAEQRVTLQKAFENVYEKFTARVREGRGDRLPNLDAVAEGRLFTGRQAVASGMADKLGSLDAALADLAAECQLAPGSYDVVNLPAPQSLTEFLESMFQTRAPSVLAPIRSALGEQRWHAVAPILRGLTLLRDEHALTLLPIAITVK
mgnify:CR=1 FL=1